MASTRSMSCSMSSTACFSDSFLIRAATTTRSASARPAKGSSSSSSLLSMDNVTAISSRRLAPCGRLVQASAALSARPTASRMLQVRSLIASSPCASANRPPVPIFCPCTATRTFSNTVRFGNTERIWNEREMPRRARACTEKLVMSLPSKKILPLVGGNTPVSMLNIVVLPAPFGPSTECSTKGRTSRLISLAVTRLPNCLDRFCV